ncbi:MAG: hypothetical protein QXJ69_01985 [Desulfurococcaceae archaeon]
MDSDNVLRELSYGRNIVMSYLTNTMFKMLFTIVSNAIREKRELVVVDESKYVARYIPLELVESILVVNNIEEACNEENLFSIVFMPRDLRKLTYCRARDVLVFTKPIRIHNFREYVKYYLEKVAEGNEYVLKSPTKGVTYRFKISKGKLELIEKPAGILGQAYEIIKNTMSMYGDTTVRDIVVILTKEIGVDKKEARKILVDLARRGYIRVHKGRITLA